MSMHLSFAAVMWGKRAAVMTMPEEVDATMVDLVGHEDLDEEGLVPMTPSKVMKYLMCRCGWGDASLMVDRS